MYTRLRIITRRDIREIAKAYLAPETIDKIYARLRPILTIILPTE